MMALTLSSSVHFQDVIIQVFLQADRFWQCCLLQAWSEVPHILWHCRVLLPRSAAGYISNFLYFNSCLILRVLDVSTRDALMRVLSWRCGVWEFFCTSLFSGRTPSMTLRYVWRTLSVETIGKVKNNIER